MSDTASPHVMPLAIEPDSVVPTRVPVSVVDDPPVAASGDEAPPHSESSTGAFVTTVLSMLLLGLALALACLVPNPSSLQIMLTGGIMSMATLGANYWLGSSRGSAVKTGVIAAQLNKAPK